MFNAVGGASAPGVLTLVFVLVGVALLVLPMKPLRERATRATEAVRGVFFAPPPVDDSADPLADLGPGDDPERVKLLASYDISFLDHDDD